MEAREVGVILHRIKSNYPMFNEDDEFLKKEWYRELKDYDYKDVTEKLEEHFRSEQYGNSIPKVYFLTKYLKKTEEKNNNENIYVCCTLCKKFIDINRFRDHYSRCSSINYMKYWLKKVNQPLSEEDEKEYFDLPDDLFEKSYNKFLGWIYQNTDDIKEQNRVKSILMGHGFDIRDNF